jgi:hypothetical protein
MDWIIMIQSIFKIGGIKMLSLERKEPFAFYEEIPKGETVILKKHLELASRIKKITINIPTGPEGALQIKPYYEDSKGTPREIVNWVGSKEYINGDNIVLIMECDVPVESYSNLCVKATNTTNISTGFDYPLQVIIEVEYYQNI